MSGGALDYAYGRINDMADAIDRQSKDKLHRAFAAHLRKVANAAYELEWMLSGDTSEGDEIAAIKAVIKPPDVLVVCVEQANQALTDLKAALADAAELARLKAKYETTE